MNSSTVKMRFTTALVCLITAAANGQWSETSSDEIVIRGGWLFDGISDSRRQNSGIVIRDGKIVQVDASLQDTVLSATTVIDLAESDTILPGMIGPKGPDDHADWELRIEPLRK